MLYILFIGTSTEVSSYLHSR